MKFSQDVSTKATQKGEQDPVKLFLTTGSTLTISFLLLSLFYWYYPLSNKSLFKDQVSFVVDLGLLNITHIIFTFTGFLLFNEFRDWFKSSVASIEHRFLTFGIPLLFLSLGYVFFSSSDFFWRITRTLLRCYGVHHSALQTYGIFLIYGKTSQAWKLKPFFFILSFAYAVALMTFEFADKNIRPTIIAFLVAVSVFVVVRVFYFVKSNKNDFQFMTRLLLYPLGLISPIAGMGISAVHGIEYGLVFNHFLKRKKSSLNKKNISIFMVVFSVFSFVCYIGVRNISLSPWGNFIPLNSPPLTLILAWVIIDYVNVLHYYFDWKMFRMKIADSRTHILPLFR